MESGENVSTLQSKLVESGHAPVNGINMYYEVHGRRDGVPLVLLHGGGSTIEVTFSRVLPVFASSRRVIAVEEQGHGRTTDRNAPVLFGRGRRLFENLREPEPQFRIDKVLNGSAATHLRYVRQ
jgi:pimeloyl-ACP methyl ester carboxylesterase